MPPGRPWGILTCPVFIELIRLLARHLVEGKDVKSLVLRGVSEPLRSRTTSGRLLVRGEK